MTELVLTKVTAATAAEIAQQCQLQEAQAVLQPEHTPAQFLEQLMAQKYWADAVRFLAHGLPKREAVWWSCICVEHGLNDATVVDVKLALQTAKQWVYQPTEEHRRVAQIAAEKVGYDQPVSWAALAAFWSGGSITAPEAPEVAPGPSLTGHAVAGAILLAAVQEPAQAEQCYQRFLQQGIHIANGGNGEISGG